MPDNDNLLGLVSHETIYQAIYVLPSGEIRKEIIGLLRQERKRRVDWHDLDPRTAGQRADAAIVRRLGGRFHQGHGQCQRGWRQCKCIARGTLVERKSRFLILAKMDNCGADAALAGFTRGLNRVPRELLTSLAYDQGKEMARHAELAKRLNFKVYFCDPHSPAQSKCFVAWQRPTNENSNGLIRQYLPKGIDLSDYSQRDLDRIATSPQQPPPRRSGL